ncbi:hypothetical protein EON63_17490 [archaeon]|nr:MAG: hypothetical protein EON63_17490 [archaeon]
MIGLYYAHDNKSAPLPAYVPRIFQNLKTIYPAAVYVGVNQERLADNSKLFVEVSSSVVT